MKIPSEFSWLVKKQKNGYGMDILAILNPESWYYLNSYVLIALVWYSSTIDIA